MPGYGGQALHEYTQYYGTPYDSEEGRRKLEGGRRARGEYATAQEAQMGALGEYQAMIEGERPSLAEQQMQAGIGQAQAAAAQQAAAARGGNIAGSQLASAQSAAHLGGQAAQQGAMLRAQEQQMALQGAAGLSSQMAQQSQAEQLAYEQLLGQQLGQQLAADVEFRLGSREARIRERKAEFDRRIKGANFGIGVGGKFVGSILSAVSDIRRKENIEPGGARAAEAVGSLDPLEYDYKSGEGLPSGRRVGVSAQQVQEKIPEAVVETDEGKALDVGQLMNLVTAASADQERRLRSLEESQAVSTQARARTPKDTSLEAYMAAADEAAASRQAARQIASSPSAQAQKADVMRELDLQEGSTYHFDPYFEQNIAALDRQQAAMAQLQADRRAFEARAGHVPSMESARIAAEVGAAGRELGPSSLDEWNERQEQMTREIETKEKRKKEGLLGALSGLLGGSGDSDGGGGAIAGLAGK